MRMQPIMRVTRACMATLCGVLFAGGCSFDPLKYMSRNACELFNCDELFFIEDMFPLSARPSGDAGATGGMIMDVAEAEDEGGGHAH